MRKIFLYTTLVIASTAFSVGSKAQKAHPDVLNKKLLEALAQSAHRFCDAMESADTAYMKTFLSPELRSRPHYGDTLLAYARELKKYTATTMRSVVGVFPEYAYNTFRVRYGSEKGDYFYIDLYYPTGSPAALIAKIKKVPAKVLQAERDQSAKSNRDRKLTLPPPTPANVLPGFTIEPIKSKPR